MKRLLILTITFLFLQCSKVENVPPAPQNTNSPYLEAKFIYPKNNEYFDANQPIRISVQFKAEVGTHDIAVKVENQQGTEIKKFYTHTHAEGLYIFDTLWKPIHLNQEWCFLIAMNVDHLNNLATDTVKIYIGK